MITRIEIDGFKSFVDFSLDLAPFTAVIGTNAGGKSNLIDAFRFLAASVKGERLRKLLRTIESVTEPRDAGPEARPTQVLLASHSPAVLDVLPPENVVFLDAVPQVGLGKRRRVTRARRAAESTAKDSTANGFLPAPPHWRRRSVYRRPRSPGW